MRYLDFVYKNYSKIIPHIGQFIVGDKKPYEYLVKSIEEFINQEELIDLMKKHSTIHASGHVHAPTRKCPAVSLTGIQIPHEVLLTGDDKEALIHFSVTASELEVGSSIRAWWD